MSKQGIKWFTTLCLSLVFIPLSHAASTIGSQHSESMTNRTPSSHTQLTEKLPKLTLAGPFAAVSDPLIRMVETNALADIADDVEFVVWKNPDQMRAMALNSQIDFIAAPTNVAANLYNRGAQLKLVNVSIWGILWMVSREQHLNTIADFKGKEIAMPFRGDMPDLIFTKLIQSAGLNKKNDFQFRYVANPLDAMQLLITRRVDHALLAEPAVSMALRKTQSFPISVIAPELHRSLDIQQEWGRLLKREHRIPQAGMALLNTSLPDYVVQRFQEEYRNASQWCNEHPELAGQLVAKRIEMLIPEAVADSIRVSPFDVANATSAQKALEFFFTALKEQNPAVIGGKLPDQAFYY